MKAHQAFVDKNLTIAFKSFYAGFLTNKEITDVIAGKDMWLNSDEVNTRWQNRLNLLALSTPFDEEPVEASVKRRGRPSKASV